MAYTRLVKNKKAPFAAANRASLVDQGSLTAEMPQGLGVDDTDALGRGHVFGLNEYIFP
jgi:hypothetical protein